MTTSAGLSQFDIAIAGAGAAGLSLAWHLNKARLLGKQVVLVDQDFTPKSDKTWCFWNQDANIDPSFLKASWSEISVITADAEIRQKITRHSYHCVDSQTYQAKILSDLRRNPDFTLLEAPVREIRDRNQAGQIVTSEHLINAPLIFQSVTLPDAGEYFNNERVGLKQHFLGWEIEVTKSVFDAGCVILHDFRVNQQHGFAFVYVLPFTKSRALVELTYFTRELLAREVYDQELSQYLEHNWGLVEKNDGNPDGFRIERREFGMIPMVDGVVKSPASAHIFPIGTAAGLTKGSTGYTYSRIHQDSRNITSLIKNGLPIRRAEASPWRYRFYDLLILNILRDEPARAVDIFFRLFERNGFDMMFAFLDEKLSFPEEVQIMASVPRYNDFFAAMWKTRHRIPRLG
jgi:lycopene beta-cyclase